MKSHGGLRKSNPQRAIGLGACPSVDNLKACLGSKFDAIPVIEYVTWTVVLPVSDSDIASTFNDTINLFGNTASVPGVASVDSSFVVNGILQTDMFIIGFGVHVFAEPQTWTQIGNSVTPTVANPPSPDVYTLNDLQDGALGTAFGTGGAIGAASITPAVLEWGAPAWRAAWQASNAYRFVWTVNQRVNVIDEQLADVSYFGPYADAKAAGDSDIPIHPFVQRVNARYAGLASGSPVFWPVTHRRVGSVGGAPPTNVGFFHPTRDFDLAATTWGGLANNAAGQCNPYRKLPRPCLIERGLPIGMTLEANDSVHQANFQSELSASGAPLNGNGTVPELDAPNGGSGGYTTGTLPTMTEQTVDVTPVLVAQQVQVARSVYKGGLFKISFLLKGYEVMRDWCAFLTGCDAAGNLYMTSGGNSGTGTYNPTKTGGNPVFPNGPSGPIQGVPGYGR